MFSQEEKGTKLLHEVLLNHLVLQPPESVCAYERLHTFLSTLLKKSHTFPVKVHDHIHLASLLLSF